MITGAVTAFGEAVIPLRIVGSTGEVLDIEAVIDTGFNGFLTLPTAVIDDLRLPWRRRGRAVLADGTETIFDTYDGSVVWDGQGRRVAVDGADSEPLVGMALLGGFELTIAVTKGGQVTIQTL